LSVYVRKRVLDERIFESCSQDKTTPVIHYDFRVVEG
jgi:hypothetical protein